MRVPSAPWKRAVVQGVAIAVLALAIRALLDGGVTGQAITFAMVFGLVYALITAAFARAGGNPDGRPRGDLHPPCDPPSN